MKPIPPWEYLEMTRKKPGKYKAKKVEVDGIIFDSKREARHYGELQMRLAAGEVAKVELQPVIEIVPKCVGPDGKAQRAITYRGDFKVTYPDGRVEVQDVKGMVTKDFRLKEKMLWALHGIRIVMVK